MATLAHIILELQIDVHVYKANSKQCKATNSWYSVSFTPAGFKHNTITIPTNAALLRQYTKKSSVFWDGVET